MGGPSALLNRMTRRSAGSPVAESRGGRRGSDDVWKKPTGLRTVPRYRSGGGAKRMPLPRRTGWSVCRGVVLMAVFLLEVGAGEGR